MNYLILLLLLSAQALATPIAYNFTGSVQTAYGDLSSSQGALIEGTFIYDSVTWVYDYAGWQQYISNICDNELAPIDFCNNPPAQSSSVKIYIPNGSEKGLTLNLTNNYLGDSMTEDERHRISVNGTPTWIYERILLDQDSNQIGLFKVDINTTPTPPDISDFPPGFAGLAEYSLAVQEFTAYLETLPSPVDSLGDDLFLTNSESTGTVEFDGYQGMTGGLTFKINTLDQVSSLNVPAMGGIGLLALGLSMLGLGAVRLMKK